MPPPRNRLTAFDGLRGVAALVVVLHHTLLAVPDVAASVYGGVARGGWAAYIYSPLHILTAGTEAVVVFFILSGFVLTGPVLRGNFDWAAYYPSRLLRLYLPVIAAVIWSLLVVALFSRADLGGNPSAWLRAHDEDYSIGRVLRDSLLVAGTSNLDGPLWTLRWEVLFSLLLPVYVWLAVKVQRVWLVAAASMIPLIALVVGAGVFIGQYLPMFAIGVLMAVRRDAVQTMADSINARRSHAAIWGLITALAIVVTTVNYTLGVLLPGRSSAIAIALVPVGAALWVFIAYGCGTARRFLDSRSVQWLGAVSFSLYLTHEPIVVAVAQSLPAAAVPFGAVISVPLSLVVAWGFSLVVEKPAHRFSQSVRKRIASRRTAPAQLSVR